MKVHIESVFDCSPELVWDEVQTSRLLLQVLKPLVRFAPLRDAEFPNRWEAGGMVRGRMYALGFIPMGTHGVYFEKIDPQRRQIQTREYSAFVQQFDHSISVQKTADGMTRYSDTIEIHSGLMTFFACLFTWLLFQCRHLRWKSIASRLAQADNHRKAQRARRLFAAVGLGETRKLDTSAITVRAMFPSPTVLAKQV
jgi:hypothetical protein